MKRKKHAKKPNPAPRATELAFEEELAKLDRAENIKQNDIEPANATVVIEIKIIVGG